MIDHIEQTPSTSGRDSLRNTYHVEFVVPASGSKSTTSKRSVTLTFPLTELPQHIDENSAILKRARKEIVKLLRVASVPIKAEYERQIEMDYDLLEDQIDQDELPLRRYSTFNGLNFSEQFPGTADWRRRKLKIDWEEEKREYNAAIAKMNRDLGTLGKLFEIICLS